MQALKQLLDNLIGYFNKPIVKPEVKAKPKARAKKK